MLRTHSCSLQQLAQSRACRYALAKYVERCPSNVEELHLSHNYITGLSATQYEIFGLERPKDSKASI